MLDASTMPATGPTQSLHLVGGFEGFDAQVTDDNGNVVAAFWEKRHVLENRQSVSRRRLLSLIPVPLQRRGWR